MINLLIILLSLTVSASQFPIWAKCQIDATERETVGLMPSPQDRMFGLEGVKMQKRVLVQVWKVDNQCAWISETGNLKTKLSKDDELTCIPEKDCMPIIRGDYGNGY